MRQFPLAKPGWILTVLITLIVVSLLVALSFGAVHIQMRTFIFTLMHGQTNSFNQIIISLRLSRALTALATGGLLALSGLIMQVLLQNPLADPYVLGISGGANTFSLIAMLLGWSWHFQYGATFFGAMLAMLLVFGIGRGYSEWSTLRMLLVGIIVAAGFAAVTSLLLLLSNNQDLGGMLFWLMGGFSFQQTPGLALSVLALGIVISFFYARKLNIFSFGQLQAKTLGVNVNHFSKQLYFFSAFLTATAVMTGGAIGFVGLISPHLLRLIGMRNHRYLIFAAPMVGGLLLLNADTLARTVIAPQELPVGIVTALLGIPLFLVILMNEVS